MNKLFSLILAPLDNGKGIISSSSSFLGGEVAEILNWVYMGIVFAVPVIVAFLSIKDFLMATTAGKEDEMKKAQSTMVKRIIIGLVIIFVPILINVILNLANIGGGSSRTSNSGNGSSRTNTSNTDKGSAVHTTNEGASFGGSGGSTGSSTPRYENEKDDRDDNSKQVCTPGKSISYCAGDYLIVETCNSTGSNSKQTSKNKSTKCSGYDTTKMICSPGEKIYYCSDNAYFTEKCNSKGTDYIVTDIQPNYFKCSEQ